MRTDPPPPHTTANFAGDGATVGVQADNVHNVNVYQVGLEASPQKKYEVGRKYLEDGVPSKAEELISAAITAGYDNAEVRFHWVLAVLSKRSYRDLSRHERERLNQFAASESTYPVGEYQQALEALKGLLSQLNTSVDHGDSVETRILELPAHSRAVIDRHLGLVISGATRDKLWQETREQALHEQFGNNRLGRIWAYFHPKPAGARARHPEPPKVDDLDRFFSIAASLLFAVAVGYLGWLIVSNMDIVAILVYLIGIAAGFVAVRDAFEWRYRTARINAKDFEYFIEFAGHPARGQGFVNSVARSFDYYFAKYRPNDMDVDAWLNETAGIRGWLRDEVSQTYRETRTPVKRLNWLIGFLARDIRRQRRGGALHDHHARYKVAESTKIQCTVACVVTLATAATVVNAAYQVGPITTWLAVIVLLFSGPFAALCREKVAAEERRYEDERQETEARRAQRETEYWRWKTKLDSTRPNETEMETWLQADKTRLIDEALRHYRLSWRDVIAHAVIHGPAKGTQRNRVQDGPWRYSKYDLRLFLITKDGVREVISELDFKRGTFTSQERNNFRFEAVSSVNVTKTRNNNRTLNLTLMNGPTRDISITGHEEEEVEDADTPDEITQISIDASGFAHALRILEGIAAEGKGWIERDKASNIA